MTQTSLAWNRAVLTYCRSRESELLSLPYQRRIKNLLLSVGRSLENAGLACHPSRFGKTQLNHVNYRLWPLETRTSVGYARNTLVLYSVILVSFLKTQGRGLAFVTDLSPGAYSRWRRQALGEPEARRVLETARRNGLAQWAIVAFELTMGLRRAEVLDLKLPDIAQDPAHILGKGRRGGKRRWVPISREVRSALPRLLANRRKLLRGIQTEDPGYLLCRVQDGRVSPMSKSWADGLLRPIFVQLGIKTEGNLHHALRRTFGRLLWSHGVPLEAVGDLFGHENLAVTKLYLALDNVDRATAVGVLDSVFIRRGRGRIAVRTWQAPNPSRAAQLNRGGRGNRFRKRSEITGSADYWERRGIDLVSPRMVELLDPRFQKGIREARGRGLVPLASRHPT